MKGPGATHRPHLGNSSLVDLMSHGRACVLLNPYYTVLFANATEDSLAGVKFSNKEGSV
jgi:alcohol dehydrogenase